MIATRRTSENHPRTVGGVQRRLECRDSLAACQPEAGKPISCSATLGGIFAVRYVAGYAMQWFESTSPKIGGVCCLFGGGQVEGLTLARA